MSILHTLWLCALTAAFYAMGTGNMRVHEHERQLIDAQFAKIVELQNRIEAAESYSLEARDLARAAGEAR